MLKAYRMPNCVKLLYKSVTVFVVWKVGTRQVICPLMSKHIQYLMFNKVKYFYKLILWYISVGGPDSTAINLTSRRRYSY